MYMAFGIEIRWLVSATTECYFLFPFSPQIARSHGFSYARLVPTMHPPSSAKIHRLTEGLVYAHQEFFQHLFAAANIPCFTPFPRLPKRCYARVTLTFGVQRLVHIEEEPMRNEFYVKFVVSLDSSYGE